MKSCTFGGVNNELVVGGSDDFGVYCWEIPAEVLQASYSPEGQDTGDLPNVGRIVPKANHVLRGHR